MTSPLIATKTYAPRPRAGLVDRSRITSRLRSAAQAKLTLVSAPAGFGKTTAVAAWLDTTTVEDHAVAWVSLDEHDAQPGTFWAYVVASLQRIAPDVGASLVPLLQSGQPATEHLVATLVNDIGELALDVDLVLDDYHLADSTEVAAGMAYLLDNLPPNLHVVISTRADPGLPIARLRARGELVELRARDLRFTTDEAAAYLVDIGGLAVSYADVAALADRTEGWAAAIQLAALSMQGRADLSSFVETFAGDDRFVVDYLADEVLSRQPKGIRDFLLRTSVLDRLTGDLCDTVTEAGDGRGTLEALERANLFLVPLDDHREWYRYHHLFQDVLRAHLDTDLPGEAATLHARASRWYETAGEPTAAVHHALAAGDVERAADLVEAAVPALGRQRAEATLRAWVDDFPDDVVRRRPVLALGLVGGLMQQNEFGPAEAMLAHVEHWLPAVRARLGLPPDPGTSVADGRGPADLVFVEVGALARLPAGVEMYRAALALIHGDPSGTVRHAERAFAEALPGDHLARGAAAALSGLARWSCGELEAAHDGYTRSVADLLAAGHRADVLGCTITLGDLRIAQGRLRDALAAYEDALRLAFADGSALRGTADMHTGLAEIALERGDVVTARQHLTLSPELGEPLALGQNPYRLKATFAALAEAEGDLGTARDLLVEAQQVYLGDFSPDVRPLHARLARIDVALGDVDAARRWADDHQLSPGQEISYLEEYQLVTLAEVLLARHRHNRDTAALADAQVLLPRLHDTAAHGGRVANLLDVTILHALASVAVGDDDRALEAVRSALDLGAAEGHVRAVARHRDLIVPLLDRVGDADGESPYLQRVREAARRAVAPPSDPGVPTPTSRAPDTAPASGGLVDPLSTRELEVLRLLASDLDGPEIARHLVVSVNTLRTHTKNIYAKLGVNSRRAALRRAHELGLPLGG